MKAWVYPRGWEYFEPQEVEVFDFPPSDSDLARPRPSTQLAELTADRLVFLDPRGGPQVRVRVSLSPRESSELGLLASRLRVPFRTVVAHFVEVSRRLPPVRGDRLSRFLHLVSRLGWRRYADDFTPEEDSEDRAILRERDERRARGEVEETFTLEQVHARFGL